MLRTVKYLSLLVVQVIGALLGVGALFIAFYAVSTPLSEFESAGWRILGMAFACGMMFPFVLQASLIQSYMPLPLSMGVTRRGFFAAARSSCMRRARRELGSSAAFAVAMRHPPSHPPARGVFSWTSFPRARFPICGKAPRPVCARRGRAVRAK